MVAWPMVTIGYRVACVEIMNIKGHIQRGRNVWKCGCWKCIGGMQDARCVLVSNEMIDTFDPGATQPE